MSGNFKENLLMPPDKAEKESCQQGLSWLLEGTKYIPKAPHGAWQTGAQYVFVKCIRGALTHEKGNYEKLPLRYVHTAHHKLLIKSWELKF